MDYCKHGWQLLEKDNAAEAAEEFQKAIDKQESNLEAHEGMGLVLFQTVEKYETIFDSVVKVGSIPMEELLKSGKDAIPGTMNINGVSFKLSGLKEIVTLIKRTHRELKRAFELGTQRVDVLEALARIPIVDPAVCDQCIEQALKRNPKSAWANYLKGMKHVYKKNYEAASRYLERAIQSDPAKGEWRSELGSAYTNLGKLDKAIEQLLEAVRLKPSFASAWFNLGTAWFNSGHRDFAIEAYRNFLKIEPFSLDAEKLRGWFPDLKK